jgi:stage II sporulation protein D
VEGKDAVFRGRGRGHGAGLCQWGAAGLARAGQGWRAILARYYPGAELRRMY